MMKQLLSNIERNRAKLRQEFFEAEALSSQRKIAISGLKEKIDKQARTLQEELEDVKEKSTKYRMREEKLRSMS